MGTGERAPSEDRIPLRLVSAGSGTPLPSAPIDLDTVFRSHVRYVASIAYRLLGRDDDVDDVVQEVFVEATLGLHRLNDPGALRGWLRTVTIRNVSRRLRARKMRRFFGLDRHVSYESMPSEAASPETQALFGKVYRVLDELPTNERLAWTLRHVEGEALEDVATHCGCSLATAKRRIASAHDRIQKELGHG